MVTLRWVPDQGTDDIAVDRLGMEPYLGPLPQADPEADGYGGREPQAFMVEMGSGADPLITHFHVVDQFQVFVHGSGTVGRHAVETWQAHYADRCTPYGPLAPGPSGVAYVTLRARSDTGLYPMPAARASLQEQLASSERPVAARRNLTVDVGQAVEPGHVHRHVADEDGLVIATAEVGPASSVSLAPIGGSGAYLVVVAGAVAAGDGDDGEATGPGSLAWVDPGAAVELHAGPTGARVAVLQLPA
jgi:hypothetical protein